MNPAAAAAVGNLAPSGATGDKAKATVYIMVAVVILIIIIIIAKKGFGLFDSITGGIGSMLETLGLKKSDEEKAIDAAAKTADQAANLTDSPFNPNFYKTSPAGTPLLTSAKAKQLVDQIWNSVGVVYDDPEQGLAAIKQCANWASVSFLSDMFQKTFNRDLYGWLQIKYDTTRQKDILTKIVTYARSLKKY